MPVVRPKKGYKESFFRPIDWSIHLIKNHWNVAVALHEAAHAIHFYYFGETEDDHDEKWLGIFVYLLVNSGLWPKEAILASLKAAKLEYSHMMTPDVLRQKTTAVNVK